MKRDAQLLADAASESLDAGVVPADLVQVYSSLLRVADDHLAAGQTRAAARSVAGALKLAFDRNAHFDAVASPLAKHPREYVQALEESTALRRLRSARGRTPGMARTWSAPAKALVLTRGNDSFLGEILGLLAASPDWDPEFHDLSADRSLWRGVRNTTKLTEEIFNGGGEITARAEQRLRPLIQEADTVFIEWCTSLAALASLCDPGGARVILRLHSFEAFSHWPHLIDFSRVDDVVFVSEHLRDFAVDAIPGLREENAPRLHVLPLAKKLSPYGLPKTEAARFNVGLVGWGSVAKDPLWATEVVRHLRQDDPRYRLVLIGPPFDGSVSPSAGSYAEALDQQLAKLRSEDAVEQVGATDDVPSVLRDVGVILSSSVRESFHAGLVEGAASGALPVVRDWPFFAGRPTSARTLFPDDWVVSSPQQAAQRILRLSSTSDAWLQAGRLAAEHAIATWDWPVVRPLYARLFDER